MRSLLHPQPAAAARLRLLPPDWQPVWSDLVRCRQGLEEITLGLMPLQEEPLDAWPRGLVDEAQNYVVELRRVLSRLYELLATSTPEAVAEASATASFTVLIGGGASALR